MCCMFFGKTKKARRKCVPMRIFLFFLSPLYSQPRDFQNKKNFLGQVKNFLLVSARFYFFSPLRWKSEIIDNRLYRKNPSLFNCKSFHGKTPTNQLNRFSDIIKKSRICNSIFFFCLFFDLRAGLNEKNGKLFIQIQGKFSENLIPYMKIFSKIIFHLIKVIKR